MQHCGWPYSGWDGLQSRSAVHPVDLRQEMCSIHEAEMPLWP